MRRALATALWIPMSMLVAGVALVGGALGIAGYLVLQVAAALMPAVESLAQIGDGDGG